MKTLTLHPTLETVSDERLWRASLGGDRAAFGRIVERYQALICALAYSGTGNLAGSEDLAQETFVTAWQRLAELREPAKLRQWLCGIVRNLAADETRRLWRRGGPPTELAAVAEPVAAGADPEAAAVSQEEEALVWRALGEMPATYREPLVLFYREDCSVAEVATRLDLSEDAAKQRLSRGRAMLRAELSTLVTATLTRSRPTAAFTAAVLGSVATLEQPAAAAALAGPATTLAIKTVAAKTVAAKSASTLGAGAIVGPAAGLFTAWLAARFAGATARSAAERAIIGKAFRRGIGFSLAMIVLLLLAIFQGQALFEESPWVLVVGATAWTAALLLGIGLVNRWMVPAIAAARAETATGDQAYGAELDRRGLRLAGPRRWETRQRFLGLPLFSFASGGLDVGSYQSRAARGWIAVGDLAISPFLAIGGLAIGPIAIGGATVGLLSLSLAGIALGGVALGSLAFGYWSFGAVAVGWQAAAGGVALAHDYALGGIVRAAEANNAVAQHFFAAQPIALWAQIYLERVVAWLILACIVVPLGLMGFRAWRLHR